ncbi:MAG: hypothetical protein JXB62_00590 [Pirellulales bacterium]|nr:hypothetical protein [Pirellulales bacterium]
MSTETQQPSSQSFQPPPPLSWRSWPAREHVLRTVLVVLGLLAAALLVVWLLHRVSLAVVALAALLIALWRFFVPVRFDLSAHGVDEMVLGRQRRIPWQAVRRHEVCAAGVLLLPHDDRSAMASFRGLYLPWAGHRDEVLAHVRYYLDRSGEP